MENKRILVIGGTGYIGREIVSVLSGRGYQVSVLARHPPKERNKKIKFFKGDVLVPESLSSGMRDKDVVIYLPAVIRSMNKGKYMQNPTGLENTIGAMKRSKVKRIIHFSTINCTIPKTGPYGNSKKLCERIVTDSGLDFMIIRPNVVYGKDDENDFYRLHRIMRRFHMYPILGDGKSLFEPINKKDVSLLTLEVLKKWKKGRIVHLSGKEKVSLNAVADMISKMSRSSGLGIHVPIAVLKIFKGIIPFDIEGYDKDRVARKDTLYGKSDLKDDLKTILSLE